MSRKSQIIAVSEQMTSTPSDDAGQPRPGDSPVELDVERLSIPTQKRSRERFERILASAIDVMDEKGADGFRMSDISSRTGIGFGSLYQYFPNRTAVLETLARRYNEMGRSCVRHELEKLGSIDDLHAVLSGITDSYNQFFLDEPAVFLIWQATQASRQLQAIDEEDGAHLTAMLLNSLKSVAPDEPPQALADLAHLAMVMIAAAVRHAINLPTEDRNRFLRMFKQTLPRSLSGVGSDASSL